MPSASLQSRIQAFEALSGPSSSATPKPGHGTSSVNLLETPISPTASSFRPIAPFTSPSSPIPDRKASLVDLKDWIVEDGPSQGPSGFRNSLGGTSSLNPTDARESSRSIPLREHISGRGASNPTTPLISLESPPKIPRPPLPPRKPSQASAERAPSAHTAHVGSDGGATLRPPGHSGSLTIEHSYPPGAHKFGAARITHASASSISSFHSVSLSSDSGNVDHRSLEILQEPPSFTLQHDTSSIADPDSASIADSFENISAPSATSPSTAIPFDWERATEKPRLKSGPSRLPQRPESKPEPPPKPLTRSVSTSSSSTTINSKSRRPPPPPPPPPHQLFSLPRLPTSTTSFASTSDRSSVLSSVTRTSSSTRSSPQLGDTKDSTKPSLLMRPTPVPPAARARYEPLFVSAILGRKEAQKKQNPALYSSPSSPTRKGRQAAGWRGKQGDTESISDDDEDLAVIGPQDRLCGRIVKHIWKASRLDRNKLKDIWNDCDPNATGSLDLDAFINGMWRIDEELRRVQLARRSSALSVASSQRIPHRPLLKDSSLPQVLLL